MDVVLKREGLDKVIYLKKTTSNIMNNESLFNACHSIYSNNIVRLGCLSVRRWDRAIHYSSAILQK